MNQTNQISESLAGRTVELGGVPLPLDTLCGGVLVLGATGSGKTMSVVNALASQFAALCEDIPDERAAVFYFVTKGEPHHDLYRRISEDRQKDVVFLSDSPDCQHRLELFPETSFRSSETLAAAVPRLLEEVAEHVGDSLGTLRHDVFWAQQRHRVMQTLSALRGTTKQTAAPAKLWHAPDALRSLLARVDAFLTHTSSDRQAASVLTNEFKRAGIENATDLDDAMKFASRIGNEYEDESATAVANLVRILGKCVRKEWEQSRKLSELDQFASTLEPSSTQTLLQLLNEYYRLPDSTRGCVSADIRGMTELFRSSPSPLLFDSRRTPITFEQIIDRGQIAIIHLPLADSGNAALPALAAIKLALFTRLLGRMTALCERRPLSRRPVALFFDEFHTLVSRGRTGGEDLFLSRSREFGVVTVMASQSVSLLAGALRDPQKLQGFIANCRTQIFGFNTDEATNRMASEICGTHADIINTGLPVWYGGAAFREFVRSGNVGQERLVMPIHRFRELKTGQFVVNAADGSVHEVDLDFRLDAPRRVLLKPPIE